MIKRFIKSDKGSLLDIATIAPYTFATVLAMLIGWTVLNEFATASFIDVSFINKGKDAIMVFDGMLIFIAISIIIGAVALSTQVRSHPIFFIPAIIVWAVIIMVAGIIANVQYEVMTTPQLLTASNEFPIAWRLNDIQPLLALVGGAMVLWAIHAKPFQDKTVF